MGKGDLRSKRGKIFRGTYGKTRMRKKKLAKRADRNQDDMGQEVRRPPA